MQRTTSTEAVVDYSLIDAPYKNPPKDEPESVLSSRHNIFDGDEFDVFARKDIDLALISMGKKE